MSRLKRSKLIKKRRKRLSLAISSLLLIALVLGIIILPKTFIPSSTPDVNVSTSSNNTKKNKTTNNSNSKETSSLDGYLFVGDSYTVLLKDTIKKHNPNAIVKAVSGVQPGYWLEHFDELPRNSEVKGVVLLIGVNGATFSDNIPNKQKLISSLVEKYKNKTIYVQEVFPVGKNFENANPDDFNKAIDNNNETTKKYCNRYDNVFYIDATNDLTTEDGYLKFTEDGLHIESNKQETFYKNIVAAVNKSE